MVNLIINIIFNYIRVKFFTKELIAYHSYFICCERADVFLQISNASFEISSVTTKTGKR